MDEKPSNGPSVFPDWDNPPVADVKQDDAPNSFSPGETITPPLSPANTIPVSTNVAEDNLEADLPPSTSEPQKPIDSFIQPQSPASIAPPEPAPTALDDGKSGDAEHPLAVTQVYSSYGLEYVIMLISLAILAFSLAAILGAIVDLAAAKSSNLLSSIFDPYSEAALIVSLPIFSFLFLRLEAREESHPSFLTDSSRRRGIQVALIISFIAGIVELVGYIGTLLKGTDNASSLNPLSSSYSVASASPPWWADLLHAVIGVVIAGSIFAYFWYKLHKKTGTNL